MHRKLPSFSFSSAPPDNGSEISLPESVNNLSMTESRESNSAGESQRKGRSLFRLGGGGSSSNGDKNGRSRSPSPFSAMRRSRSASPGRLSIGKGDDARSDISDGDSEAGIADVRPETAFDDEYEDEEEEVWGPDDRQIMANTEANSSGLTPFDFLSSQEFRTMTFAGEGPNLVKGLPMGGPVYEDPASPGQLKRKKTLGGKEALEMKTGRPVYERNRCTVTLTHGDPDGAAKKAKRTRTYLVASDLSDESQYAIEWAIGTVLRDGDECLVVTVVESDSKLDPEAGATNVDKVAKLRNQKERQENALSLARHATALLERTRLNVRVTCQAIHARNVKHMLVDMVDYLEPTMVIIGSRGLGKLKGVLMGSVSHYLVQKSSVPVMVARRRLRRPRTVHKAPSQLNREPRMPLDQAQIEKESHAATAGTTIQTKEEEKEEKEKAKAGLAGVSVP